MTADRLGNLYIADTSNNRIRKVGTDGTIVTVAGNGRVGSGGDGLSALRAQLNSPNGVAAGPGGDLYIADTFNNRVRKVTPTGTINTVAIGAFPTRIAVGGAGEFYFSSLVFPGTQRISADGTPTAVADGSVNLPALDGGPPLKLLNAPRIPALDNTGNLFLLQNFSSAIYMLSKEGTIAKIAGSGTFGYSGDGGPSPNAQFGSLVDIVVYRTGNIYLADGPNAAIRVLQPVRPVISPGGIANAASNSSGSIAPGEIVVIYGSNLGPDVLAQPTVTTGRFPVLVAGTRVLFNGTEAPIIYTSAGKVACIVPYEVTGGSASVVVQYGASASLPVSVPIAAAAPALFTVGSVGSGQAASLNQDETYNAPATPATPGSVIVLYLTGEGQTSPGGVNGKLAIAPLPSPVLSVSVTIGGKDAEVLYSGGAPGLVAGLMQINAVIPPEIAPGTAAAVVHVGPFITQSGVSIAIGPTK